MFLVIILSSNMVITEMNIAMKNGTIHPSTIKYGFNINPTIFKIITLMNGVVMPSVIIFIGNVIIFKNGFIVTFIIINSIAVIIAYVRDATSNPLNIFVAIIITIVLIIIVKIIFKIEYVLLFFTLSPIIII